MYELSGFSFPHLNNSPIKNYKAIHNTSKSKNNYIKTIRNKYCNVCDDDCVLVATYVVGLGPGGFVWGLRPVGVYFLDALPVYHS